MKYRIPKRKQNRRMQLALFFFIFAIILTFVCFGNRSSAKNDGEIRLYKYYTNIEVQYGDTL